MEKQECNAEEERRESQRGKRSDARPEHFASAESGAPSSQDAASKLGSEYRPKRQFVKQEVTGLYLKQKEPAASLPALETLMRGVT